MAMGEMGLGDLGSRRGRERRKRTVQDTLTWRSLTRTGSKERNAEEEGIREV